MSTTSIRALDERSAEWLALHQRRAESELAQLRQMQETLAASERQYRQLFENNSQPMFIFDLRTLEFLAVNLAAVHHYGYAREEFLQKTLKDLRPVRRRRAGFKAGHPRTIPGIWAHQKKDGTVIEVEVTRSPVVFEGRKAVLIMVRDITGCRAGDQRRALQHATAQILAESATLEVAARQFLEAACRELGWASGELWQTVTGSRALRPVCCWHDEEDAGVATMMRQARQLTLFSTEVLPEEMRGSTEPVWVRDLKHRRFPRAAEAAAAGLSTVVSLPILANRQMIGIALFFSRDNRPVDLELLQLFTSIGDQLGQFIQRKQMEEELRRKEELFRSLIENATETIAILDAHGTLLYLSPAVQRLLGFEPAELIGTNAFEMVHPEDVPGLLRILEQTVREGEATATATYRMRHRDGSWRFFESIGKNCLSNPVVAGIIVNSRDITQRKLAEDRVRKFYATLEERVAKRTEQLRAANHELQLEIARCKRLEREVLEISEAEQRRIGQDLHDGLNQHLASIHYFCHNLQAKLTAETGTPSSELQRICELMNTAMNQTRRLARGLYPVHWEQPDGLRHALEELAMTTSELFGVDCQFRCEAAVALPATGDATHLYRIAQEAIHNAVKHGAARHITIECRQHETHLEMAVSNDGKKFRRSAASRGLGMQTMSYRADVIGARLMVRALQPRGTMVTCLIPIPRQAKDNSTPKDYERKTQSTGDQSPTAIPHPVD